MKSLVGFWIVVLGVVGAGAGALQIMGPPAQAADTQSRQTVADPPAVSSPPVPPPPPPASIAADAPLAAPDRALMEPSRSYPGTSLPRVAADGRAPMQVYARPFDRSDQKPRIALLVAGLGLNDADSRAVIEILPGPVSFAVSPYAARPEPLADFARSRGHEVLMSVPMEPQGYPLNDEGFRSLQTGADAQSNRLNLEWVLTRIGGYVGVTGASDGLRGERFAQAPDAFAMVRDEISKRGLIYVDPRPNAARPTAPLVGVTVDVVIDEPPTRADIEAKLQQLEKLARDRGVALGLAAPLRPLTVERLESWTKSVGSRGFTLAPVSALVPVTTAGASR